MRKFGNVNALIILHVTADVLCGLYDTAAYEMVIVGLGNAQKLAHLNVFKDFQTECLKKRGRAFQSSAHTQSKTPRFTSNSPVKDIRPGRIVKII